MERNFISHRQGDALKLELRARNIRLQGRPAHRRDSVRKTGHPGAHCEGEWLCDNNNATLLDEIVPLWPNIGCARQYASDHVPEALRTIVELM